MTRSRRILLFLLLSSVATCAITGSPAGGQAVNAASGSALRPGRMMIGHLNARALSGGTTHYSMGEAYAKYLWPKKSGVATVYYVIDADSDPNATPNINSAISIFNADFSNIIQWVPWTSSVGPNYVNINLSADNFSGQCEANEGYEAIPAQPMTGSTSCAVGTILHEMGHIIGLWHEQSRPDRNTFVTVNYGNVIKGSWGNFEQFGDDIQLLTPYDYASIMQYPPYSFSRNGGPVIETIPAGIPLSGEGVPYTTSADYSAADKEAIERLYGAAPTTVTVTSNPVGLQVVVDGTSITTPQQFSWALNSSHTLSVASGVQSLTGDIENSTTSATFYYTYGRWNDSTAQTHTIVVAPGNGSPAFPGTSPQVATYSANFIELVPYTGAVYPTGSGTVAVSPTPQSYGVTNGAFFVARQQATLTATPTPATAWNFYEFNNGPFWLPGGLGANPKTFYVPDTGNPVDTTAEFSNTPIFTVDVQPDAFSSNLWAYVDSDFWYMPKKFSSMYDSTWTSGSSHSLNVISPLLPYSVNSEYLFSSWNDAGAESHTIASLPAASTSYVATMTPGFAPATNFSYPPCGGTGNLTPSSPTGNGFYPTGQPLTFSESPDSGWTFAGWTYDVTGTATPASLTANDESLVFANFNIVNTPLTLTGISPATANSGVAGFTLTLTGTGFAPGSYVSVNGIYRSVTYVSSTELQVTVNASDVTTPGGFQVFVENFPSGWDGCAVFGYQTFMVQGPALSQTITFPAIPLQSYGAVVNLSATASSGLPVSFASTTPSVCTVSGTTATMISVGTCSIEATQAGNNDYRAAPPVTRNPDVVRASQTITFATIPTQTYGAVLALSATASSDLTVSFASTTSSVCTVSDTTATMISVGTCIVQATQSGNTDYQAATTVTRNFKVAQAAQTITFPAIPLQSYGAVVTLSATASSGLTVSFASTTSTVCTVSGTTATMISVGTCSIKATEPGNSDYLAAAAVTRNPDVVRASQTITFATIPTQTYGAVLGLSAAASSSLTVSFASTTSSVCTVSGTTATMISVGTCIIQATQSGNSDYQAATTVTRNFKVTQAAQTITFPAIPLQSYGAVVTLSATASSSLTVSFASTTPTVCTVSGTTATMISVGTCSIKATQAGNSDYLAAAAVTRNPDVARASQTITFATIPPQTVGTPLTLSATSSSNLTVSFASTTSSICTVSGTTATMVSAGTCSIQATQAGNTDYQAAATVTRSFKVNAASPTYTLPSNRVATWNPGLMSVGGVPSATWPICSSTRTPLAPLGSNQDDTPQINAAIQACPTGSVVSLGTGTFLIDPQDSGNNYVAVNKGVALRGAGAGQTILNNPNNVPTTSTNNINGNAKDPYALVIVGPGEWVNPDGDARCQGLTAYQTQYMQLLTANGTQGSTSVAVANGSIFSAGQYVLLDQTSGASWLPDRDGYSTSVWAGPNYSVQWMVHNPAVEYVDDPVATGETPSAANNYATSGDGSDAACWFSRQDRPQNEMKQIASVSGNTITFTSPLTMTYSTTQYAELTTYTGGNKPVTYAGVENMTLVGGGGDAVDFTNTAYSWAKNIEVKHWYGDGVSISNSFRDELRDSYIHNASWAEPGGAGYAISLSNAASEILIENNISMITNKVMVVRSSGAASVVGYTYMDDGYIAINEAWIEIGLNASAHDRVAPCFYSKAIRVSEHR